MAQINWQLVAKRRLREIRDLQRLLDPRSDALDKSVRRTLGRYMHSYCIATTFPDEKTKQFISDCASAIVQDHYPHKDTP